MEAFALVYNSEAEWGQKVVHLEDGPELETSNAIYKAGGETMGGISLSPKTAVIDGDVARITYDVMFGGKVAYDNMTRTIRLINGVWKVSRVDYCDFLSSARTPCSN
ncbi:MAG: hypothetical protein CL467_04965 [Acidimicrobiaceae bacterium]|nr:hypothetical protein [Acidimicrobiaceae bacterium]|tara:strand:+ start:361 stop:681 length:321 start_codon:yes stop_codon:yes gene_type:complete